MIIVDETSINFLGLPLNSKERVRKKDDLYQKARKNVKLFEKKYDLKSRDACMYFAPKSPLYGNTAYNDIKKDIRIQWVENYEIVVTASYIYRLFIFFNFIGLLHHHIRL